MDICGMRLPLWVTQGLLIWLVKLPCDFRAQSHRHSVRKTWTKEQRTMESLPPLSRMAHIQSQRTKAGHLLLKEWVFGTAGWSLDAGHRGGFRRLWGLQTTFYRGLHRKSCCVCWERKEAESAPCPRPASTKLPHSGVYLLVLIAGNSDRLYFLGLQNHCRGWLQLWNENILAPWKKSYDKPRQHIKKQRHHFANKGLYSQSYGFSNSHVWMWELGHKEGWMLKFDAFELWCWRRLLGVPWSARRSNQSILQEINPENSLEGLMLRLKLQYFVHLVQRSDLLE